MTPIRPLAIACSAMMIIACALPAQAAAQGGAAVCAAAVKVPAGDRIGALDVPKGDYRLSLVNTGKLTCAQATRHFREFLRAPANRLPSDWRVNAGSKTFKGPANADFQVQVVLTRLECCQSSDSRLVSRTARTSGIGQGA